MLGSARNPQLGGARGARQEQIGYRVARVVWTESYEFEREGASVQCKFDRHRGKNYTTTSIQCEPRAFVGDYLRAVS